MRAIIHNTEAVVHKLFGKTHDEACKQLYPGGAFDTAEMKRRCPWGVYATSTTDGGTTVSIGFKGYINLIQFTISPYPSCCGSRLFHTFKVDEDRVNEAQLDEIMSTFVAENRSGILGACNRLEVVMVETRYNADGNYVFTTAMEDPQPVENPKIKFKSLWNFFHKNAKRVRTRLEVNDNTRNVLHNMEVIL